MGGEFLSVTAIKGGYYDLENQQCVSYKPSAKPKKAEPAPKEENSAPHISFFGSYSIGGAGGCSLESPPPLCEVNSNPQILTATFLDQEGNYLLSNPRSGDQLTLKIEAQTCAEDQNHLLVQVKINDQSFEPVSLDPESGLYLYSFTVPPTLGGMPVRVTVRVEDTKRKSVLQETRELYVDSVLPQIPSFKVYASYEDQHPYVGKKVTLTATPSIPESDEFSYEYSWKILYHEEEIALPPAPQGNSVAFVPDRDGDYQILLSIRILNAHQQPLTKSPITVSVNPITIYPAPEPQVLLSGDQSPRAGETKYYNVEILRDWEEDQSAVCDWKVSHVNPNTNVTTVDIEYGERVDEAGNLLLCSVPLEFSFPSTILNQTSYLIQVKVYGGNGAYELGPIFLPVTVYPAGVVPPVSADYMVTYHEDGAIPLRPVSFNATLINAPDPLDTYEYNWVITHRNGQPYNEDQPSPGASTSFAFAQSGIYLVRLEVVKDSKIIATKTESVEIFAFPSPAVSLDINGNEAVHVGDNVTITGIIKRHWPEDENAVYNYSVVQVASGNPITCSSSGNICTFTANQAGTYLITLAVTGYHGETPVYTKTITETMEVYPTAGITPSADYSVVFPPEGAITHRDIKFVGTLAGADPAGVENYQWTIVLKNGAPYPADEDQPANGQTSSFNFSDSGIYGMRLDIYAEEADPETAPPIASKLKTFEIYPFPLPEIDIDINQNQPIHVGEQANFIGVINRDWPEDLNASYAWEVRRVEADGEIPIITPDNPLAQSQLLQHEFSHSGTYKVILTVTGQGNVYTKTKTEFVSVYPAK